MKVEALFAQTSPPGSGAASLVFKADVDFPRTLTLGQIIKGRVLRSYEGNRYLMDFSGHERIVDSTIPLKRDEIVHGRVVGLGERVELRKINVTPAGSAEDTSGEISGLDTRPSADRWTRLLNELFERYQAKLSAEDQMALRDLVARASEPDQMALSALILTKLGLRMSPELLQSVFLTLTTKLGRSLFPISKVAVQVSTTEASSESLPNAPEVVTAFAMALHAVIMNLPEAKRPGFGRADADGTMDGTATSFDSGTQDDSQPGEDEGWSRRILNAQTGGAVAHRVDTIPLLVNGRLVELDVAIFEQSGAGEKESGEGARREITYRQLLFSLTTENLGCVEIKASLSGDRMRASLATSSSERTRYLSSHAGYLTADLESLGWHVDELAYLTREAEEGAQNSALMRGVAEHLISPGSVSRWV